MNLRKSAGIFAFALVICVTLAQESDEFDDAVVEEEASSTVEPEPEIDIPYTSPTPINPARVYFAEHFDDADKFHKTWIKSAAKKDGIEEVIAKYDGVWLIESPTRDALVGDSGLVLKSRAKHAAISAPLAAPFTFDPSSGRPLIVQYEVQHQDGQECGGAYLKLLSSKPGAQFTDKTPYTIMFGPDKCGNDHKLHFIFRHRNPRNGTVEEKHCKKPKERLEEVFADKQPHLYTLVVRPDNGFEVMVDRQVVNSGSLLEDFTPAVNPPKEIDDPADRKPTDWDEREKIPDPEAQKPADWDEDAPAQVVDENAVMPDGWLESAPSHVPDPDATKPADWDTEMDGVWEAPLIDNPDCTAAVGCGKWEPPLVNNPNYKGKWRAPLIDNPNYRGKWRPRLVANPDWFEDMEPFRMTPIAAVGFELWSMSKDILFDNLIITDDKEVADQWAAETFDKKQLKIAKDSGTLWGRMMKKMNYRPKAWGLYFLYCMIPIGIYLWYLFIIMKEDDKESFVQKIANITNEYPALWALYIIVLGIPVVFLLYLCCKPSSSSSSQIPEKRDTGKVADKKKTDEVTEDDVKEDNEERADVQNEEEDEDAEKNSGPEDEEESDEKEEIPVEDSKKEKEEAKEEAPRKRKPRKE